ncbi:protein yellow isoform X2 [Drosophila miranda]|uniref:protein yellow isoform X2 n=1 Tax=Drosophila miranda TaxID=7229 RepID=UPI00143F4AE5|nr:protein yellow isoform X2 [Drosophila miranda]
MNRYSFKFSWLITFQLIILISFVNSVSFVESFNADFGYLMQSNSQKQGSIRESQLKIVNEWKYLDFEYPTFVERQRAIMNGLAKNRSWRVTNYNFAPNPVASDFKIYGLNFQWLDGVFGMSISYDHQSKQRVLYFHPMASFKEFIVSTELLLTESLWEINSQDNAQYFFSIGDRGYNGQSSSSGIARNGVMFYTQVHRDNIGCWDTAKPYTRANLGMLLDPDVSSTFIQFPNDLKVDEGETQSVWIMSNRLPIYLYSQLDYSEINFRILRGDVNMIINSTICNPANVYGNGSKSAIVSIEEGQCY